MAKRGIGGWWRDGRLSMAGVDQRILALLAPVLSKHGLATVIALVFVWTAIEDRTEAARQRNDMNGQLYQVAELLRSHVDDAKQNDREVSRLLWAQCMNDAASEAEQSRCAWGAPTDPR